MKKTIVTLLAASLLLSACGSPQTFEGKEYPTYGLFNEGSVKSDKVCYALSIGNVVWSILLIEGVIFPVYFIGWSIMNPVRLKRSPDDKCGID